MIIDYLTLIGFSGVWVGNAGNKPGCYSGSSQWYDSKLG
jgi:hypothetical protein